MRRFLVRDKSGLSNLVAYVLLIAITISLSVLVYGWLKFYVTQQDVAECPENVNLIISSYECVGGSGGYLNLTLKNKGLFTVDGYSISVHNRTGAEFGLYNIYEGPDNVLPGGSANFYYSFSGTGFSDLTLVDVAPWIDEGDVTHCGSYIVQKIECSGEVLADCENDCSSDEFYCVGNNVTKKSCGNYDEDSCLELGSATLVESCGVGYLCEMGSCAVDGNVEVGSSENIFVDSVSGSDSNNGYLESDAKATIQAAIDAVDEGGTIHVAAGEYVESGQIVIDKDLNIVGESRDSTIIKTDYTTDSGYYADTSGWFYVHPGVDFELKSMTLDGTGALISTAIHSKGDTSVVDCIIKNIYRAQYAGIAIQFLSGTKNLVKDCEFGNIERIGVHIRGSKEPTNPYVVVDNVKYTGKGDGNYIDYGVEVGLGGQGSINNSYFYNVGHSTTGSASSAIYVTGYPGTETKAMVAGNEFRNNYYAIIFQDSSGSSTELKLHYNIFTGNQYNFYNRAQTAADITYNYWGTSVESEIAAKILNQGGYSPWYLNEAMTQLSS